MTYTREQIEKAVKDKGYLYFAGAKDYDVNIIGVRNSAPGQKVTNIFDDKMTLSYRVDEKWFYHEWDNTTEPGKKGVMQFHNAKGVARLVPGQYRGVYAISKHQGKYEALCQRLGNVTVWNFVENWSEGCHVFKKTKDFNEFMAIINKAKAIHGNHFTYTLIESNDI